MNPKLRDYFDLRLERVLAELPEWVLGLLDEVPLHVEDHPPTDVLRSLGIEHRDELCGLYTGMPLTERGEVGPRAGFADPNAVTIYREGIMALSCNADGHLNERELLRQIRITVLHELGHHHGLSEGDLSELGYG